MSRANTVGKITFEICSGWAGADLRSEHTYINSKDARAFFEGLLNAYVCREGSFPRETERWSASRPGIGKEPVEKCQGCSRAGARVPMLLSRRKGWTKMGMSERHREGLYMITKIVSGNVVERRKCKITRRPAKRGGRIRGNSSEKKVVGNKEYAKLQLARAINCNMVPGDLMLTAKFDPEGLEAIGGTYEGAKKAGRKFIDRLAYRIRKMGMVCKWFLVPSEIDGETGELVRPHVHIIISGAAFTMRERKLCLGEEPVDSIWGLGNVDVQFLRHQDDYYPLAAYLVNQARGVPDEKKWSCSRNMVKPKVTREIVTSGGQLRVPAGAVELPGTRYDPENGQNFVRYIPKRKDPRRKVGGHKEMAVALSDDDGGGDYGV